VHGNDSRMSQPAGDLGFQNEPMATAPVVGLMNLNLFQGHSAAKLGILGHVNDAKPASSMQRQDAVAASARGRRLARIMMTGRRTAESVLPQCAIKIDRLCLAADRLRAIVGRWHDRAIYNRGRRLGRGARRFGRGCGRLVAGLFTLSHKSRSIERESPVIVLGTDRGCQSSCGVADSGNAAILRGMHTYFETRETEIPPIPVLGRIANCQMSV
jgi:hypothetical protein